MTKAELIEKIIDTMTDPWNDDPEEYMYCTPIDEHEASNMLVQLRDDEESMELEPEDRLPEEVTPDLIMTAYNCLIRARKYEARVHRLAEFITDREMVCEYVNYYMPFLTNPVDVVPIDFLWESFMFQPIGDMDPSNPLFLITLGQRSENTFNPDHEFCWYDRENNVLHSTNAPFGDGVLDAEAFARFTLGDKETLDYFLDDIMTDDEIKDVFGCTKDELIKEDK